VALSASDLTEKLWEVYSPVDGDGNNVPPTKVVKALAEGVVQSVKAGIVSGTVVGTGISGNMAPMNLDIVAVIMGAKISGILGAPIYAKVYPVVEAEILKYNPPKAMRIKAIALAKKRVKSESDIISSHIVANAVINFMKVDGKSTHFFSPPPPPVGIGINPQPGNIVAGGAKNGVMTGLVGNQVAELVAIAHEVQKVPDNPAIGATDKMKKMYTAMMDYIMQNIEIEFPVGTVNGSFAPPPTPMTPFPIIGGVAAGGKVF
jgi:hypothetical protein